MRSRHWLACGALLAGLAVAAGAFGAHGLKPRLKDAYQLSDDEAERRLEIYETATRYQMYHGVGLMVVGLAAWHGRRPALVAAAWGFLLGTAIFCGCLYALVFNGPRMLGAIVPIGGVAFLVGWTALAVAAWQTRESVD